MSSSLQTHGNVFDVAIVGLGPVGATAANLLGKHGYKTIVIEREPGIYNKPRAISFDQEAMRIFQSIGLTEEILPWTTQYRPALYLGSEGQVIRRIDPSPEPFPLHWLPNYLFNQPGLEKALRKGLERFDTIDVRLEHQLHSMAQKRDHVSLTVQDLKRETEYELSARYVWACDGASSSVRQLMDLPLEDLDFDEEWIVVDVKVNEPTKFPETNIQYCEPTRPSTYVVGPDNHRRWELMLNPDESPGDVVSDDYILGLLSRWGEPSNFNIWRAAVYRFHALVAEVWSKGTVYLLGDAAHQTPPFMGQGMCQGIRDAANLIWKLNQVERFEASATLFRHYERERKPHVKALTEFTKSLGETICERDPAKAKARDARLEEDLRSGRMVTIRQNLIPNLTDGVLDLKNGNPVGPAGRLFPQPNVVDSTGREALLDDIVGEGFLLVIQQPDTLHGLSDACRGWFERNGGQIIVVTDTPSGVEGHLTAMNSVLSNVFDEWNCSALLVRPDKYIFGAASDKSATVALLNSLRRFIC